MARKLPVPDDYVEVAIEVSEAWQNEFEPASDPKRQELAVWLDAHPLYRYEEIIYNSSRSVTMTVGDFNTKYNRSLPSPHNDITIQEMGHFYFFKNPALAAVFRLTFG